MHLLLVEDDSKMVNALKRGLEEENHRVTVARDGVSATEIAEFCNFDVVLLDVMLPGLDGFEVARRLRRRHVQTPILMLTAKDAVPDITTGLDAGRRRLPYQALRFCRNSWRVSAHWLAAAPLTCQRC